MRARTGRLRRLISSKLGRARGSVEVEQRALRDREPDGALDVAGDQLVAALEPLVERVEHAPRLLAGVARALERDVVAALLGDHAEPVLDQREVLVVLAEQQRGEAVVVEGERDLGRGVVAGRIGLQKRFLVRRQCVRNGISAPACDRASASRARAAVTSMPNRLLATDVGDRHRSDLADQRRVAP